MEHFLYILWDPSATAFKLGPLEFHWYSLCWLVGLALAYLCVQRLYKEQKVKPELFDPLFIYCFIGILAGARLGIASSTSPTSSSRRGNTSWRYSCPSTSCLTADGASRAIADSLRTAVRWA